MFDKKDTYFPIKQAPACQLKWTWSSLWLTEGTTASCHRCKKVPLDLDNFDSFHNHPHKINERKIMLSGKWPTIENGGSGHCQYCKIVEDAGGFSDRMHMLTIPNQTPKELWNNPTAVEVTPKILELYINSTCNLACTYCNTRDSSKIKAEAKKFGPIVLPDGSHAERTNYKPTHPKQRQYWEKTMEYIKKNGNELRRLHILGGEPFFISETQELLDTLKTLKNPHLEFCIISNMMVKHDRFQHYIEQIKQLCMERKIGRFDLTTSIDAWGPEAEYARMGLKCDQFLKNFDYAVKEKWIVIHTQSVLTSLTIKAMPELLKILNDRRKNRRIGQEFSYVIGRVWMHPKQYGGEFWRNDFKNILEHMPDDLDRNKIIKKYMIGLQKSIDLLPKNEKMITFLKSYLDTIDKRRNTNWRKIYPYLDI
jgi:organic radical activating enzyme